MVLNGGTFCIEKMLGFRGDVVCFFLTHVFVFAITFPSFIQIERFKILGKLNSKENKSA